MFEFLDRLITIALPRVRDFHGVSDRSFDGRGNFSLGLKEQIVFPEVDYDKVDAIRGMDIVIVTTAGTDSRGQGAAVAASACRFPSKRVEHDGQEERDREQ